jgi:tetratricopeptide (TPR) repeat protein
MKRHGSRSNSTRPAIRRAPFVAGARIGFLLVVCFIVSRSLLAETAANGDVQTKANLTSASSLTATSTNSVEQEYQKLLDDDDAGQAEADRIIKENEKFAKQGAGLSPPELSRKLRDLLDPIRQRYEEFLKQHPEHIKARTAYASFLGDINDEDAAREQLEKIITVETNDPAVYNNLANIYGHHGSVKRAFEYYEKAIALNPTESIYYHNFGTTVFLFRVDAREYYGITEQQVFDKALALYSNAMHFDSTNFPLASDVAQTYYGIKPPRTEEALKAWTNAFHLAHDELEREGVQIHFARVKLHDGRFAEARAHLNTITNEAYASLKDRLTKNIETLKAKAAETNKIGATNATDKPK